jgi:hypothetical protein
MSGTERLMEPLDTNVERMEAQLKRWHAKIDEFAAVVQKSNGWRRIDLLQRIDELKIKRALLRAKLDEWEVAEGHNREKVRDSLERIWNDLKEAFAELKL